MAPQTGSTEKETRPVSAFLQLFTWEEIRIHNGHGQGQEQWLVIDRKVYDVSRFSKQHPGGSRVISHYAGQDATLADWQIQPRFKERVVSIMRHLHNMMWIANSAAPGAK